MHTNIGSPLVNSNDTVLLKTIESEELIRNWKFFFDIDISEELHKHGKISLYQCNQTKLKFFIPLELTGSSHLYNKLQKFDWYYMPEKWEYNLALQDLKYCHKVLEIGSGSGKFIQKALNHKINVRGIELSNSAVDEAKKNNLPVNLQNLQDASLLYENSLDGVCSFQVLEHVANPREFIESSIKMLKPGGKLILSVPNAESFLQYQYSLLDMPPHHMHLWSDQTFYFLEKIFPIKLEKILYEPLAGYHTSDFVSAYCNKICFNYPTLKFLFNRYTSPIYKMILNLGFRHLFRGQTLYVQFCKVS